MTGRLSTPVKETSAGYNRRGVKLFEVLKSKGRVPDGDLFLKAVRDGRVRATHDFAAAFGAQCCRNVVDVDAENALCYLRGDDLDVSAAPGQVVVAHAGVALGLAKALEGGRLKNQLPPDAARRDLYI